MPSIDTSWPIWNLRVVMQKAPWSHLSAQAVVASTSSFDPLCVFTGVLCPFSSMFAWAPEGSYRRLFRIIWKDAIHWYLVTDMESPRRYAKGTMESSECTSCCGFHQLFWSAMCIYRCPVPILVDVRMGTRGGPLKLFLRYSYVIITLSLR